jgi:hypothetical protein
MALYLLSYDLRKKQESEYQTLWDELAKFKAARVLESDWCFKRLDTDCKGLRGHFKQFIHQNDKLFVAQIYDWASHGIISTPNVLK